MPLLLLLAFSSPTCRTAKPERSPGIPEGLPPLMARMRLLSRDFKRALLLEDRAQYTPLAQALLERTRELCTLGGPEAKRALEDLAANDPFPPVREMAREGLARLREAAG